MILLIKIVLIIVLAKDVVISVKKWAKGTSSDTTYLFLALFYILLAVGVDQYFPNS